MKSSDSARLSRITSSTPFSSASDDCKNETNTSSRTHQGLDRFMRAGSDVLAMRHSLIPTGNSITFAAMRPPLNVPSV